MIINYTKKVSLFVEFYESNDYSNEYNHRNRKSMKFKGMFV